MKNAEEEEEKKEVEGGKRRIKKEWQRNEEDARLPHIFRQIR